MQPTPTVRRAPAAPAIQIIAGRSRPVDLARTHAAIWWLHDAADYRGVEAAGRELVALALPDCTDAQVIHCAAAIRACYETYDAAQESVREWHLPDYPLRLEALRAAHRQARIAWCRADESDDLEEGYFAFFAHSMWLHAPGWRRPLQKLWRNPARLAGIWRYHRASFGATHPQLVAPAVKSLFWAGLEGHDYKSRAAAEGWLERYWLLLTEARVRHLFF